MKPASNRNAIKQRARVLEAALEKTQRAVDQIMASLARDIRFDPRKLFRADGTLKTVHELDEDTRLALRRYEVREISKGKKVIGHRFNIQFPDKLKACKQAMKYFRLYK